MAEEVKKVHLCQFWCDEYTDFEAKMGNFM